MSTHPTTSTCNSCKCVFKPWPGNLGRFCSRKCKNDYFRRSEKEEIQNFWMHVNKDGPYAWNGLSQRCWLWVGNVINGYGHIYFKQAQCLAHRVSWEITFTHPAKHHVLHRCDNPLCVNPCHLFLGTAKDNVHDAIKKGRNSFGERRYNAKLNADMVRKMRAMKASGMNAKSISKIFSVHHQTAWKAIAGATWGHVTSVSVLK